MKNPLWKLDEIQKPTEFLPMPTGTLEEQEIELIRRCDERDAKLSEIAIEAERDGDEECCWMGMAARAHNKRARNKIAGDLERLQKTS